MNCLLDTHTFIWWDMEASNLPQKVYDILLNSEITIYLSVVSVWEIQIKSKIGKLDLRKDLKEVVEEQRVENGFRLLPVTLPHVLRLGDLSLHHNDPFDRLLISQAKEEDLTLLTKDQVFSKYDVEVLWS